MVFFFVLLDDRKEAYSALRQLIKQYLGLEEQEKEGVRSTRVTPQHATTGGSISFCFYIYNSKQSTYDLNSKTKKRLIFNQELCSRNTHLCSYVRNNKHQSRRVIATPKCYFGTAAHSEVCYSTETNYPCTHYLYGLSTTGRR